MMQQVKLTAATLFQSPTGRVIIVLGTMMIAALVGGAPSDAGGH